MNFFGISGESLAFIFGGSETFKLIPKKISISGVKMLLFTGKIINWESTFCLHDTKFSPFFQVRGQNSRLLIAFFRSETGRKVCRRIPFNNAREVI